MIRHTDDAIILDTTSMPVEESDQLTIRPLGSGQEVGRSCHMLEFKGKRIMLDCGIHPGMSGIESLPYTDIIDPSQIDLLLISHFHLDHCGGLPWFLEKTTFQGRCFMTHATKAIYRWLLSDFVKVSNIATDQMLYTEADIEKSMDKIETIHFHQEVNVNGIKFYCYNAGHVLGAAMFMIEIAGVKILYSGDFSRQEDRHLMSAEIPSVKPDVLIVEATYGTHIHEPREERESRFTGLISNIVRRGGRCLIPVFALGRAQELLLILDEFWSEHPELHDVPIFYASSLAKKCMSVYQTYISAMNEKIRKQIAIKNPFVFKHVNYLKSIDHFEDVGPSVVMASPGMMQNGLSRELFEGWCTDKRNGVIIAGYCVEGTLAKHILTEPDEIVTMNGQKLPRKCSVDYISFSAHTDYRQTSEFINILKPPHIVLVHGERNEMNRLKLALTREYDDESHYKVHIYNPKNTQAVELYFRGEKMAKVIGQLAADRDKKKDISGVLVKRNFNYHLMAPSDLSSYTELTTCTVFNKQSVPYGGTNLTLRVQLNSLAGDLTDVKSNSGEDAFRLFDCVNVWLEIENECAILEWKAGPVTDMFADSVVAVLLKNQHFENFKSVKKLDEDQIVDTILDTLSEMFGKQAVDPVAIDGQFQVSVNGHSAVLNVHKKEVLCPTDKDLEQQLKNVIDNVFLSTEFVNYNV